MKSTGKRPRAVASQVEEQIYNLTPRLCSDDLSARISIEELSPADQTLASAVNDLVSHVSAHVTEARQRAFDENRKLTAELEETRAVASVVTALTKVTTEDEALRTALDSVRSAFGWAYGSYWALDRTENALRFRLESGTVTEEFHRVTKSASFSEGVGLSGRTWRARDLYFVRDLGQMVDCCRRESAQRAGVKSGVCFPITKGGEVVGTMDFFMLETIDPSPERL
ncbi:MAG: GAF domain-containing protein, partial [Acidobacteriota bacterium]